MRANEDWGIGARKDMSQRKAAHLGLAGFALLFAGSLAAIIWGGYAASSTATQIHTVPQPQPVIAVQNNGQ